MPREELMQILSLIIWVGICFLIITCQITCTTQIAISKVIVETNYNKKIILYSVHSHTSLTEGHLKAIIESQFFIYLGSSNAFTFNVYKLNESSINGCFSCAKYLPQCTVCLKFMSINLTPVPTSNAMSQPISVNPTSQYMIPLNRSQSLYAPSKIKLPLSSTNSASKIAYDLKTNALISPPQNLITAGQVNYQNSKPIQYNSGSMYISNSNNSNNNLELEPNEPCEEQKSKEMLRQELQSENLQFLETNRFGKWFAWCQTCKHGGHIRHLMDWFKNHDKCPFLHCKCECLNLDNTI